MHIRPHLKAKRLRVLLMHIVYKIHVQGVITHSLLVAVFHQSVFVVGCWTTKRKIRLVLEKGKLATNVVDLAILGKCVQSSLHLNTQKSHSLVYFMTPEYSNELSDDEYLFTLGNSSRKVPVIINGQEVPMNIDSGATVNVQQKEYPCRICGCPKSGEWLSVR